MNLRSLHRPATLVAMALLAFQGTAQSAVLAADGSWAGFLVDDVTAQSAGVEWIDDQGTALHFGFSIAPGFQGTLTVVDAGFSGDRYLVKDGAAVLGSTGAAVDGDPFGAITFSYDDALANAAFSRAVFTLGAGVHDISGVLSQSLSINGTPLNASIGGLRLAVSAVPEPTTLATLLAGLSLLAPWLRRRNHSN